MQYFWNHEYRHIMRGLKPVLQNEIKKTFSEWDLDLSGKSDLHLELINEVIGDYTIEGEPEISISNRLHYAYSSTCLNCGLDLSIDCGDAEPNYNDDFCSVGCYINKINK